MLLFMQAVLVNSYHSFRNLFSSDENIMDANLLVTVEVKAEQISLVDVIIVKISQQLLFPAFIVFFSMPDFHFDDILFPAIINDDIRSSQIPCSGLDIVISDSVDDRFEIEQEILPPLFFQEFFVTTAIDFCKMNHKFLQNSSHIQMSINYKLTFLPGTLEINITALLRKSK